MLPIVEGLTTTAGAVVVDVVVDMVVEKGDAVVKPFLGLFGFTVTSAQSENLISFLKMKVDSLNKEY